MTISDDVGSKVEWWTGADVSGRIAQLGGRVLNPVADKIVSQFFTNIQQQMSDVDESEQGRSITNRLRNLL
ncbi:CoxG family protein [Haladaptatus sp. R4]|uniref:CoxG family protein n=1 Tax=Haladaptatus sp. R4 TaxID=1679489 RepID=UPI000AB41D33|nr:SRPBCC domain-containing protein [Haladaptatus sp. R4]